MACAFAFPRTSCRCVPGRLRLPAVARHASSHFSVSLLLCVIPLPPSPLLPSQRVCARSACTIRRRVDAHERRRRACRRSTRHDACPDLAAEQRQCRARRVIGAGVVDVHQLLASDPATLSSIAPAMPKPALHASRPAGRSARRCARPGSMSAARVTSAGIASAWPPRRDLGSHRVETIGAPRADRHRRAVARQPQRGRAADSRGRPRDRDHSHLVSLPLNATLTTKTRRTRRTHEETRYVQNLFFFVCFFVPFVSSWLGYCEGKLSAWTPRFACCASSSPSTP